MATAAPSIPAPTSTTIPTQSQLPEYNGLGGVPGVVAPSPTTSTAQLNQSQVMGQLGQMYQNSVNNFGANAAAQYNPIANQAARSLAQSIKATNADFNARGMLNSGQNYTGIAGNQANTAYGLQQAQYGINQGLLNQQNQIQNAAINAGYNYANANPNIGNLAGNAILAQTQGQIAQQQAQQNMIGGFAQAGGNLLGYGIGNGLFSGGGTIEGYNPNNSYAMPPGGTPSPGPWAVATGSYEPAP